MSWKRKVKLGGQEKKATENDIWNRFKNLTCVVVGKNINGFCYKEFYKEIAPDVPIIKYKAKADDKMKFTKENVIKLTNEWIEHKIGGSLDLQNAITNLDDDTPEKVIVPKFVAEWIEWNKQMGVSLKNLLKCYADFCRGEEPDVSSEWLRAVHWYVDNPYKFIQAYEDGYIIEPEQLYCVPLPHLETADGTKQYLTKSGAGNYFALSPCVGQKQRFTKEELERVPEVYKPYAKPIKEEEE